MPRVGATFHAGDKEVPRSKVSLPIVVKKVKGVWLLSGRAWIKKTDVVPLEAAIKYYTDYLNENGPDPEALVNRGRVWSEQNDSLNAINDFTDAIALDPKSATAFSTWAYAAYGRGH